MSFARAGLSVGLATVISRLLGFARDVLIARALGAGVAADAFLVAFRLPNLARRMLAEGGLNAGFVPLYSRIRAERGESSARRFAAEATAATALVLLALTGVVELFAPALVLLLATGYGAEAGKLGLATYYTRLAFPFVAAAGLASLISAQLNAERRFAAAAAAPALVNVLLIGVLLALEADRGLAPETAGAWLAVAVSLSGVAHLLIVAAAARRLGLAWPRPSVELGRLARLALPALAASGTAQLMLVVATAAASHEPSAVSWLYYADRVFQLPLSFVGVAVGIVLLPDMAAHLSAGDEAAAATAEARALEGALALALPAAVALAVLAEPMTRVLFERGAFGPKDSAGTASALAALAVGLPAAVIGKIFVQPSFARESLRLPLGAGLAGLLVAGAGAFLAQSRFGVWGIGLATSLGLWLHAAVLYVAEKGRSARAFGAFVRSRLPRLALASAAMGLAVAGLARLFAPWLEPAEPLAAKIAALAGLCTSGLVIYAGAVALFGGFDLRSLRRPTAAP